MSGDKPKLLYTTKNTETKVLFCVAYSIDKCSLETYQQQGLSMYMYVVRRHGCQQSLKHPQLNAIIWDVIAPAQQLNSLCLQINVAIPRYKQPISRI